MKGFLVGIFFGKTQNDQWVGIGKVGTEGFIVHTGNVIDGQAIALFVHFNIPCLEVMCFQPDIPLVGQCPGRVLIHGDNFLANRERRSNTQHIHIKKVLLKLRALEDDHRAFAHIIEKCERPGTSRQNVNIRHADGVHVVLVQLI